MGKNKFLQDKMILRESADLFAYRIRVEDCARSLFVAMISFTMCRVVDPELSVVGGLLGGIFSSGIFLVIKITLPLFLYTRVLDLLRYRLAFFIVDMTGAVAISTSVAYSQLFSSVDVQSLCALASVASVLSMMRFLRKGDRLLLALSYFIVGALFVFGFIGVLTLIAIFLTLFAMRHRLARITVLSRYSGEVGVVCVEDAHHLCMNVAIADNSRILSALSFLLGLASAAAFARFTLGVKMTTGEFVRSLIDGYAADLQAISSLPMLVMGVAAFFAVGLAMHFSRKATDIFERLRGGLMLLYASLLFGGIVCAFGVLDNVSFLKDCGSPSCRLFAMILIFGAFTIADAVFVVELGCRQADGGYYGVDMPVKLSVGRATSWARSCRAICFSVALLVIVMLAPYLSRFVLR